MARIILLFGAVFGLLGVAFGAFGAHGLRTRVAPDMLAVFETGVRYQMYHALVLLFTGWVATTRPSGALSGAGIAFAAGIVIFSGSLYALVLSDTRWLGAITPIGGLALILGWGLLAFALSTIA